MTQQATFSDQELATFIEKLETWAERLSEREREFLGVLLADAVDAAAGDPSGYPSIAAGGAASGDDVVGFGSFEALGGGFGGAVVAYSRALSATEGELLRLQD